MPPKRQSSASSSSSTTLAGGSGGNEQFYPADEFTRTVKRRYASSTRTGQACDRCKVRKIRCDGLPGGCSPCSQNRTECRTTDRISQKAIPRGYIEALESKCAQLEVKNKEMEAALTRLGIENRNNGNNHNNGFPPSHGADWMSNGLRPMGVTGDRWQTNGKSFHHQPAYAPAAPCCSSSTPDKLCQTMRSGSFRPGNMGAHYLGISSGNSYLSSMKASALSLLGIDIDLSDLDPNEPARRDGVSSNDESYGSCLATIFNVNPNVSKVELPPKEEAMGYVDWFFHVSHPYLPILHKPTFVKMLERMYSDKSHEPTAAQIAMVHMVFAIVHFQNATQDKMKNRGQISAASNDIMQRSRNHYHYALSFAYGLVNNGSLEDLQAIGLMLQHLRAFPKPGGSWLLSRLAISMCLELGLHRSAKKWVYPGSTQNVIEIELRKRVFWCILTLETSLGSRLGRPMSIRDVDYDVEYPERIDDEYITETGFLKRDDGVEGCAFDVAIEMFKYSQLYIEMHSTLYAVARPSRENYVSLVEDLEGKLIKWKDQASKTIDLDSSKIEKRFQAAHLLLWFHECRILMRHPSLSLSPSPSFTSDCIRICVESSREILRLTDNLRKGVHYLDTTWYGTTIQLLATLTILFSVWEKRDTVTPEEVARVKDDMDLCMDIMGDVGSLLGSPNRLREVVQVLTHGTMELLHRKSDQNSRRSPAIPPRSSSGSAYPPFSSGPTPSYTTLNSVPPPPVSGLKLGANSHLMNEQYSAPLYPMQQQQQQNDVRPNPGMVYTNEPIVSLPENPGYEGVPTSAALSNAPIYSPGIYPSSAPPPFQQTGGAGEPFPPWGWNGNESWREYMQSISHVAGELDPTDTYSASALIALNQDCNNGASHNGSNGGPNVLGLNPQGVNVPGGPVGSSQGRNSGYSQDSGGGSWGLGMGGYGYAGDPALRGVPSDSGGADR
ncbi:hypothetical protein RUND412_008932 [Rhizina undulata]